MEKGVQSEKSGLISTEIDYNELARMYKASSKEDPSTQVEEEIDVEALAESLGPLLKDPKGYESSIRDYEDTAARQRALADGSATPIIGREYNYDYADARTLAGDDLTELQAQRQSQWAKRGAALGRVVGEFGLNVLEIPGVVGGAIAAGLTFDVDKMTDNFWVNYTNGLKDDLHDLLPVYQRRAVKEGNVFDKMFSADWWAVDGASGIAFMGAALIPGLGLAKLPKALSLTRALGAGGKWSGKVLGMLDDVAAKTGMAQKSAIYAGKGKAAKQGIDLFNMTMANTIYESGVEARGAQIAYKDALVQRLRSGEISQDKFEELSKTSGQVAANTFGANVALLMGPNMVMSKMILGPRATSLAKAHKETTRAKATGRFAKKAVKEAKDYTGVGAKAINPMLKASRSEAANYIKGGVKTFGKNTAREGLLEEGGQGAIEEYFTEGTLEKQLYGERSKTLAKTYMDFLGTADGQAAVLLGGILGSATNVFTMKSEKEAFDKSVDNLITGMNAGIDYKDALTGNVYKTDPEDASKLILDEKGQPIVDLEKAARLTHTIEIIEKTNEKIEELKDQGDYVAAEALAANMQANFMYKFIEAGEQGIDILKDVILDNPTTQLIVDEYNKEFGTKLTVEEYAEEEVQKAVKLKNDYFVHTREVERSLSRKDINKYGIKNEDRTEAENWRDGFNNEERVNYTTQQHVKRFFEKTIEESKLKADRASKEGNKKGLRKAKREKARAEKNLKQVLTNIEDITTDSKIDQRWDAYYKERSTVKKINSKEITDYLDGVIGSIKKATSENEVEEIIAQAKKDGLILKGVKEDALPEELVKMASSDNVLESLGALLTLRESNTDSHAKLRIEAARNLDRLHNGVTGIYNSIREAMVNISEKEEINSEKRAELAERFDTLMTDVKALSEQIHFEEGLDKRKTSAKAKKNYRAAVKARNQANRLLSEVSAEITAIDKQRMAANRKLGSYLHAMRMVADVTTNKRIKETMNDFLKNFNEDNIFIAGKPLETMPFKMDQVLEALYKQKELMENMSEDIGGLTMHATELEYLNNNHEYYTSIKNELNGLLGLINKTIKKNAKLKQTPENVELLVESNIEARRLEEKLAEVDAKLFEIEDKLSDNLMTQLHALDSYMNKVLEVIDAIETLDVTKVKKDGFDLTNKIDEDADADTDQTFDNEAELVDNTTIYDDYEATEGERKGFSQVIKAIEEHLGISALPAPIKKEFKKYIDSTEGKGFERINEEDKGIFETLFSNTEEDLLNDLKVLVGSYAKGPTGETLRDIYMVLRVHPHLASKVPSSIHEELVYASDTALDLFKKFSNYKKEAPKVKEPKEKKPDKKKTSDNPWMDLIISETNIEEEIQAVIDEKKASLRRNKLAKLKKSAQEAGLKWDLAIATNDAITEGSEVYTDDGKKGNVVLILRTKESGINVLIETENGEVFMVSIETVSKKDRNTEVLNKNAEQAFRDFSENKREKSEGGKYTSTSVSLVGRDKPSSRRNPQTGAIEGVDNAFLTYMHEPRDKSNDIITPSFSMSYLKDQIKASAADPARVVEYDNAKKAMDIWDKFTAGGKLTVDELEHLADYTPITLRVDRSDGEGGAGTYINIKTEKNAKTSYKSMEGAVRRSIIEAWRANGLQFNAEGLHPNTLKGVTLKWSHIGQGQLNVDPSAPARGFNALTDLQGVTADNMQIFAVQEDNADMKAYDKNGEIVPVSWTTSDKKGMVILELTTNTGTTFPLILEQKKLAGTSELDIVMDLIEDILIEDKVNFKSKLSDEISNKLKEEIPLLFAAFGNDVITYEDLYRTILYPGKANTQTQVVLSPSKRTITVGDIEYSADEFTSHKGTIKNILGFKYHRTGFSNPADDVNMLKVDNEKYLKYLLEDKILRTNVVANEDIFVSIPVEGSREHKGMGAFLTKASVRSDKKKAKNTPSKENTGKVRVSATVRQKLHTSGIKVKSLSDERLNQLNELFEETSFKGAGRAEFEEIVKQINDEAGDNKTKPC